MDIGLLQAEKSGQQMLAFYLVACSITFTKYNVHGQLIVAHIESSLWECNMSG